MIPFAFAPSFQIFYMNVRYILFIHLVANDMVQVILTVSLFIIGYTIYKIYVSVCCVLVLLAVFTTENTCLNLACMAMECYVAICIPLRHMQICTIKRTLMLIGLIWTTTFISALSELLTTLERKPLDFFHSKVVCLRRTVFSNAIVIKKRDLTYSVLLVIVWLIIFYTYFKIIFTAKTVSKDFEKARNTIILHGLQLLLSMTSYITPLLIDALEQWFPKNHSDTLFVCYVIVQLLPRLASPIIYGLRDQTFRKYLKMYLLFCS